jgi:hypothetical protein
METLMQTCSVATLNSGSVESDPIDHLQRKFLVHLEMNIALSGDE